MLRVPYATGNKIREAASSRLGVELHGPPAHWGWGAGDAFGIEPKRQPMAVIFLIDRTFEAFLQKVVDAVVTVYDKYLEPDDLVGPTLEPQPPTPTPNPDPYPYQYP